MAALKERTVRLLKTALTSRDAGKDLADAVDQLASLGGDLSATAAEIDSVADESARVVNTTAATIAITVASHSNKFVVLDSTHTQTATLPAASGSGASFTFVVGTKGTDGSKVIKVANATDILAGVSHIAQTDVTQVAGFATTATDDTVTLNNTTKGGFVGDIVEIKDIKTGVFSVRIIGNATGTVLTPFSASV